ncbi:MAG: DNA methyltransferase [Candidatus Acidiferrales bacterium]
MATKTILRFDHLTYRGNSKETRYGWLRLTPAFSVHLVADYVRQLSPTARVLDPFCGTGTTALVCAEEGIHCESADINPFLLWLAEAKCAPYSTKDVEKARLGADAVVDSLLKWKNKQPWLPKLHHIEKWWEPHALKQLARIRCGIENQAGQLGRDATSLLQLAFCRTMIDLANVSFAHQSMSFKKPGPTLMMDFGTDETQFVVAKWEQATRSILNAALTEVIATPRFVHCDARTLDTKFALNSFDCVVTSPPYPNRMSYIRELRPYMYWLGYINNGRDAGEMDWEAIGGTWGCATSNLTRWKPPAEGVVTYREFDSILSRIALTSPLLSRYVNKYFCDMVRHIGSLSKVVKSGGSIHYVVGNSKFYDVVLPVQEIFASLFSSAGFVETNVKVIRKRTSKKELFEYVVSARKS